MGEVSLLVCVITYEPSAAELQRACAQLRSLGGHGVIHDNSVTESARALVFTICAQAGIELQQSGKNIGTAGGLNALVRRALNLGATWLLYLDQDSELDPTFTRHLEGLAEAPNRVALIGSRYVHKGEPATLAVTGLTPTRFVIASGTAMRVRALLEAGGFDEVLFLDTVDHEICLRLRTLGWQIMIEEGRVISHEIGEDSAVAANSVRVARHPLWRRRQMWRNSVFLVKGYAVRQPRDCAVHIVVRVIETIAGVARYRSLGYLTTAMTGFVEGIRTPYQRRNYL